MERKQIRILYLDHYYNRAFNAFLFPEIPGVDITLIPEILDLVGIDEQLPLQQNITVDVRLMLNATGTSSSVYFPSTQVLRKIHAMTSHGEVQGVILGSNAGSGLIKARHIAPGLCERTIVISTIDLSPSEEEDYRRHNITRFSTYLDLHVQFSALIDSLMK